MLAAVFTVTSATTPSTSLGSTQPSATRSPARPGRDAMKRSVIFAVLFGFVLGAALVMRRRADA
jgi:hypothetical protein